jgi:hypothetical protein
MMTSSRCAVHASVAVAAVLLLCAQLIDAEGQSPLWEPIVRLTDPDAVCLDGTPGAFYFRRPANAKASTRWLWYFEGGGWCISADDCYWRSKTELGSSLNYTTNFSYWAQGLFSENFTANPMFCEFNFVYVKYCDGNSYAGTLDAPYTVPWAPASPIYLRGKQIREAVVDVLVTRFGLGNATEFVLSGCSAGGLAAYLHADVFAATMQRVAPRLAKYTVIPVSGFFLDHSNLLFHPMYENQMKTIFALSNASYGLSPACIARYPAAPWRCNFAEYNFIQSSVPTFVLNSKTDMAQIVLQFLSFTNGSLVPPFANCTYTFPFPFYSCFNESNVVPLLSFESDFITRVLEVPGFLHPGNGYFISSCWTHCEAQINSYWNSITIGGTSMRLAVEAWYTQQGTAPRADASAASALDPAVQGNAPTAAHRFMDCDWTDTGAFWCNPTCPQVPPP